MNIGVFDSGLGGLTVLSAILKEFSNNSEALNIYYVADTFYAPYGDKTKDEIINRSIKITDFLIQNHDIKALVVACNSATSAAVKEIRENFKDLIIIGTEPGLKPAINISKTNKIAVLATKATIEGEKYQLLANELKKAKDTKVYEIACVGLADAIERGEIDSLSTLTLLENWLEPLKKENVDTIVLGCTHYPLIAHNIKKIMGEEINIIQTSGAIARYLKSKLENYNNTQKNNELMIYHSGNINQNMVQTILENQKYKISKCEI